MEDTEKFHFNFYKISVQKMNPLKGIKSLLRKADFFSTIELFRYSEQSDFRTVTGGICSISIITIIMVLLVSMVISTLDRANISYSQFEEQESIPSPLTLQMGDNFMFGVELYGLDLNAQLRYFDVSVSATKQVKNIDGSFDIVSTPLKTQPCEARHFRHIPNMDINFQRLNAKYWVCPAQNQTALIQGKATAPIWEVLLVTILKCNESTDPSRTCANQSDVDNIINSNNGIYFSVYFQNSLVNPSTNQLLTTYLNDDNFIRFSNDITAESYLNIEEYTINTDTSLWPVSSNEVTKGPIVRQIANSFPEKTYPENYYAYFVIQKSSKKRTYTRSFVKFDAVFSYVGGLFGSLIGMMFIMKLYTEFYYELSIGSHLFRADHKQHIQAKKFNLFKLFGYLIFTIASKIGLNIKWRTMEIYSECRKEIKKQLDVKLLLERLLFFERAFGLLFDDDQFKGLHLQEKLTLKQAQHLRQLYAVKHLLAVKAQNKEEGDSEKSDQIQNQDSGNCFTGDKLINSLNQPKVSWRVVKFQLQNSKFKNQKNKVVPMFMEQKEEVESVNIEDQIIFSSKNERSHKRKDKQLSLDNQLQSDQISEKQSSKDSYSVGTSKQIAEINSLHLSRLKRSANAGDGMSQKIMGKLDKSAVNKLSLDEVDQNYTSILKKSKFSSLNNEDVQKSNRKP